MSIRESGIHTHEEWKGMTQPVGLVVEPIVLDRFGIFPEQNINILSDLQRRLEELFIENDDSEKISSSVRSVRDFCQELLGWQEGDLISSKDFHSEHSKEVISVSLDDYEETLMPDWIVPNPKGFDGEIKAQLFIKELPNGTSFDHLPKNKEGRGQWEATPQQRFERLLKESEHPVGILWNGIALRLVYAPRGESSGHITFPLEPMTSVDGRPMIGALEMLLGPDRLFEGGSSYTRLKALMEHSRREQNGVSTRLAEQVLEALWILVRGLDKAEQQANQNGSSILGDLPSRDPSHIYGGMITVLLRLVFLLYAEDEELMPRDSIYGQYYSVSGLALKLRRDRVSQQNAMEGRRGAWASLLSLFRLVFDGGGPNTLYLPARHGELFDPNIYPFLEGRSQNTCYKTDLLKTVPSISDDVIEQVLNKLLILDGQLLSYRSLDVEQIGSVYEAIMGFTVEVSEGNSIGILYRPPRQNITITYVANADKLLAEQASKREKWLKDQAGTDLNLSEKTRKKIKAANNLFELCEAFENKLSIHTKRGLSAGRLYLQPTAERRRSGSHYTPRSLAEPITLEAFRPWLEKLNYSPSPQDILNLKVCDPAMGSGAFLVSTCRFLANLLVQAWERDGFPKEFNESYEKDIYARRLIAQTCLYGVDKNKFAVNLAKLSLWLVTLSKDLPFTFVDHSIKCGDSLIGHSLKEIQASTKTIQLNFLNDRNQFLRELSFQRQENFAFDNRDDQTYDHKKLLLEKQLKATESLRLLGDLLIASFFDGRNVVEREEKRKYYLSQFSFSQNDEVLLKSIKGITSRLAEDNKGIKPFHWDLEFPEVFNNAKGGFNILIGNPPFAGSVTLSRSNRAFYTDYLRTNFRGTGGNVDLTAYFFRRAYELITNEGTVNFIATNTISQGATRSSGLAKILSNNGIIFNAIKRAKWPGVASVIISIVHIIKSESYFFNPILNNQKVKRISAYLTDSEVDNDPHIIDGNRKLIMAALGKKPNGKGFIFSDHGQGFIDLKKKDELISIDIKYKDVIKEYLGGSELNKSPLLKSNRYIIDFESFNYEEALRYKEALGILKETVKPFSKREDWWLFQQRSKEVTQRIKELNLKRIIVMAETSDTFAAAFRDVHDVCCSNKIIIFTDESYSAFSIIQSRIHEYWSRMVSSTLKDDFTYVTGICFNTFPFPKNWDSDQDLEILGEKFYKNRSNFLKDKNIGLTQFYNLIHDKKCNDPEIKSIRSEIDSLDRKILSMYGYENVSTEIDFYDSNLTVSLEKDIDLIKDKEQKQTQKIYYGWSPRAREKILSELMSLNFALSKGKVNESNQLKNNSKQKSSEKQIELQLKKIKQL